MRIFAEGKLSPYLGDRLSSLQEEVRRENSNKLLNYNESRYIEYLVSKYSVNPLRIAWDALSVSEREEMIRAERHPGDFYVHAGKTYPRQVLTYHLPFSGEKALLRLRPSSRIPWTTDVGLSGNSISFDIINWRDDPEEIKREAEGILSPIRRQSENVDREVSDWNAALQERTHRVVTSRKQVLLEQSSLLERLGVPIRRSESVPSTFSIPVAKKEPIIRKPEASAEPFAPEPSLAWSIYDAILHICYEMGREMERHPAVYFDKDEETLRDHFIMQLSPHFQSVSGETFNKEGKTDILIRHEGGNVFVAECKFWGGIKRFFEAIDQLLSYLTWRDSKAAILLFVRNKRLGPILDKIRDQISEHPSFVKAEAEQTDGWLLFRFHLPSDESRGISVTVLCFHFPD